MGGSCFDQLARTLASPENRRDLLRLLVSVPLSALLASLPGDDESEAKRRNGRRQDTRRVGAENHKHSGRRRKHNLRHKHRHNGKKNEEKGCQPAGESCGTGQICNDENQCVSCGGDGQPCCPGGACDGTLVCDPQNDRCSPADIEFILSGGADPATPLRVDDDMQVLLNGQIILDDGNGITSEIAPLVFRAQPGDTLRVNAINVVPPCLSLRPLYLHVAGSTGQPQELDAVGVPQSCAGNQPGLFYAKEFTIAL